MRKALTIFLLSLLCLTAYTQNRYIKPSVDGGNDTNTGLSDAQAWASTSKVNSSMALINQGDSILYKCGGTYPGALVVTKNGNVTMKITVSSYGTGAKPIITALTPVTGWTGGVGNIWTGTPTIQPRNTDNCLTIDGVPQAVGRTAWAPYTTATVTQLTAPSLTTNFVGAQIVMRKNEYAAEKALITAQTGTTVTYIRTQYIDPSGPLAPYTGTGGYSFFLQRFLGSLDTQGEWFYDTTAHTIKLYSAFNPSTVTVKTSFTDTLINLNNRNNIVINNLAIEGAGIYGVENYNGNTITVTNCAFNNNTRAVYIYNSFDAVVDNNTFDNSFCNAIYVVNNHTVRGTITNNTITNTGQLIGMGLFWSDVNLKGIVATTDTISTSSNYLNIINNSVVNTGHAGIQFQGSNVLLRRCYIDTFDNQLDDNGGIYTFYSNGAKGLNILFNRVIDSSFIGNAIGAPISAAGGIDVAAFYLDDQSWRVKGYHNTIWNVPGNGVQWNTPTNDTLIDNTIYNTAFGYSINDYPHSGDTRPVLFNNFAHRNIVYQKTASQYITSHGVAQSTLDFPLPAVTIKESIIAMANMDSNWISNLKAQSYQWINIPIRYTLQVWRDTMLKEIHSVLPSVTYTGTNSALYLNPSYSVRVISFPGFIKVDPKGNVYNNQATVPGWSSLILIDNGVFNQPPIVNAGADQIITLPLDSTIVIGSATDPDGTIVSYLWTKVTGPTGGTIATPTATTTKITALQVGTYTYQLAATDNGGNVGTDQMQITVLPAVNTPPTANAGPDKTITLPTTISRLDGSGSDPGGTIVSYAWVQVSGPATSSITSPSSDTTAVTGLTIAGTYTFRLTVTDNGGLTGQDIMSVTVNPAPNVPPVSVPGADRSITLPINFTTLDGSGSFDPDGTITAYLWTHVSGPTGSTLSAPTSAMTTANGMTQGVHVFSLQVTDNKGSMASNLVRVTVNPALPPPNEPPVANAGPDQVITLPTSTTTLDGSASTDPDGHITNWLWTKISGPTGGTITVPTDSVTTITGLTAGVYLYNLKVTDNLGDTSTDAVQITVNPVPNVPPTADAGASQTITLPTNSTTLNGHGHDTDGSIVGYQWTQTSGPNTAGITTPTDSSTNVTGLIQGVYIFRLRVTDNSGDTASASVQVTVNPAPNVPPTSVPGANQIITLPVDSTTFNGHATDPDGTIVGYLWTQISGPTTATIGSATDSTTKINDLVEGTYVFQLRVTDNSGDTGTAVIQVTVLPAPNIPPIADAGPNTSITLPLDSVTLEGHGHDQDGTVVSYHWVYVSGPATYTIQTPNDSTTIVSSLLPGTYVFRLTVTDNDGGTGTATVTVVVYPAATDPALLRGYRIITN